VSNPVPPDLQGRPFVEQARALPARVALEAFFAAAAGFTEESPDSSAFLRVLERVALEIFRGDTLLQVRGFSPGQQMPVDYIGRAVHQLSREDSLLGSIVSGLFAEWHLASMVCQWAKQDQTFYGNSS